MSKKVLILMSDTSGGHRVSAEAIKATFNEQFGDKYQVFVTDLWTDHMLRPFNQLPRSYNFLVKYDPLWRMTYYAFVPRVVHQSNFAATSAFIARKVAKGLMKYQPDIIISVHPLMKHVPLTYLEVQGDLKEDYIYYCCNGFIFHKLITMCYCPLEEVARRALNAGFQLSQIKVFGLPVRPSFVKLVCPKVELRKELEMKGHLPAVLLMGGGEGMGPIEGTTRALADKRLGEPIGQVLVICGRNKKLVDRLNSVDWKIPVQKCGICCREGMREILKITKRVGEWFGPRQDELKVMSQNAIRLAKPDVVFKIVHDMHQLLRQRSFVPPA
ncbi:hypothetical protein H5410_006409 [Solanum commersonii]|uniref:Diacylglycerol glucosyltransferase N-terminal domain-containing protein n=1 Tax=Solanum commersonii TaxID=4109 RepID=A0A9J6AB84_SOLCO|nr:hypothetical protein H5410_006409 [Solanum commersonii]